MPGPVAAAGLQALPLRLLPGDDLRTALGAALAATGAQAAFVVAGIGSLGPACIRFAGADAATHLEGEFEILTLSGTLAQDGVHLHIAVADAQGQVLGGHVARGCIVRTTAEVLVTALPAWSFTRTPDPRTGYDELAIAPREPG